MFWIKSTDSNGVPMPMRTFDFSERIAEQANEDSSHAAESNAVSREEFDSLKAMFSDLKTTIEDILK